jgi:hypothetical protein
MPDEPQGQGGDLTRILALVEEGQRQTIRKARRDVTVLSLLLVAAMGYLTWLYRALSKLDAQNLTEIAASHVEDALPTWGSQLEQYAIEQAPALVGQGKRMMLEVPRLLREELVTLLDEKTEEMVKTAEAELDVYLRQAIEEQLASIQEKDPHGEVTLQALLENARGEFRNELASFIDVLYDDYTDIIQDLNAQLKRLQREGNLSEAERNQKEIIEVWMTLAKRNHLRNPFRAPEGT